MKKYQGIFPALVTPYNEAGDIDTGMIHKLVKYLSGQGVSGFYAGGSTGESYLLTVEERKTMLEAVVDACGPGMDVIANIGMISTKDSILLAEHAERLGVSAISAVPPFYFPFTMEEYMTFYQELSEAVQVPVLLYNIPAMSGVKFSTEDLECLLENEKMLGLKHTSYDLFQMELLIRRHPEKNVFVGHDELFLSALSVGAKAGIGSTFNIMPDKFIKLMDCFAKGEMEAAAEIQGEVNGVIEILGKVGVFKGIKEILRLQGFDCGECRQPFKPLTMIQKKLIRETAIRFELI